MTCASFAKTMSSYVYTPLPPRRDEAVERGTAIDAPPPEQLLTRLLTIHEGEYDDDIAVDLDVVDLGKGAPSHPEYEALSYVWGSEAKPCTVFVGEHKRTIPITENLDEALRHLRYPDRPRHMWIDSLCIDQGNMEERGRQVANMSHIYWNAPRVVVWLGPEDDDSDLALETLEDIGSRIEVDWKLARITGVTELDDEQWGEDATYLPLSGEQATAILGLMQRPWFERIWIRQEVFQANEKSLVVCGTKAVAWATLRRGLYCCVYHRCPLALSSEQDDEWLARHSIVNYVIYPNRYSLLWLRSETFGSLCSDPRDRIYALLGLLNNNARVLGIVPDYSKTASETYRDVVVRHIEMLDSLDLLRSCGRDDAEAPSSSVASTSVPTWVPDWSVPRQMALPLRLYRPFCPFKAHTEYLGNNMLRAAGVSNGTVQDFIELQLHESTDEAFAASIREIMPPDAADRAYPGGGNLWDAYRITLCAEYFSDRTEPPYYEAPRTDITSLSRQDSEDAMRSIMDAGEPPNNNYLNLVDEWELTLKLFTTREGYIGWGPKTMNKGDQIVNFLGCDLPIMIRKSSDLDRSSFEVIGPCYLHGFMWGEAFLGPLPDYLRPVRHIGKSSIPRFHDSRTGDVLVEDPRLSTLPVDLAEFRSLRERGFLRDLDIGPELWRSWGVEVVDFDLV